jgi:hypothetical protein
MPYLYEWITTAASRSFLKGVAISWTAAAAHHVTLIFGVVFFALPVLWVAILDAREPVENVDARDPDVRVTDEKERVPGAVRGVLLRTAAFALLVGLGIGIVLAPYWISILRHPVRQMPIPHDSRSNFLLNSTTAINYFVIPYGALILAIPFILVRGAMVRRLRPLLFGFWLAFIFGLGGTTPVPRWLLGRAFEILTFERFTFWATLLAMPLLGAVAVSLLDRFSSKAAAALRDCVPEPRRPRFLSLHHAWFGKRIGAGFNLYECNQRRRRL